MTTPSTSSPSRCRSGRPSSPRSFSGDKAQLTPAGIKAAIEHPRRLPRRDLALRAFNNHAGSTKSFDYVREHNEAVNRLTFITGRAPSGRLRARQRRVGRAARRYDARLAQINSEYDVHDRVAA